MITVGVDVASQPERTAACWLTWSDGHAKVARVADRVDDDAMRAIVLEKADQTGVDVPLGWPDAFVRGLSAHHDRRPWPVELTGRPLHLRATDIEVCEVVGRRPLSVSTDRIAYPALRMAQLLGTIDRTGDGPIVEVYPAAALRLWGLPSTGYKRAQGQATLASLVSTLRTLPWLHASDIVWEQMRARDDLFDALVAALVARAKAIGLCRPIPDGKRALAAVEGWIALPQAGSLEQLPGGSSAGRRTHPAP